MPGWLVATEGKLTVAMDITVTEELRREGVARELVNRIQNIRKESGFDVTDKIRVTIGRHEALARGGRIVRRLHCRADAGRFGRYGRCVGDARGAGDRDRRSESRLVGRKGIDCPALFAEPCEIVCLFIK